MDRGDSHRSLYLDGKLFEVDATQHSLIASFVNKTTFGDPKYDSDPLVSAKIYTSFLGGIGIERAKEAQDDQRYWIGGLDTRRPFQTTLAPKVHEWEHSANIAFLGMRASTVYAATATTLHTGSPDMGISASLGAIAAAPVYRGWEYKGKLYIPQSSGYQTYDGSSISAQNTTVKAICFCEWDDKLYALCSDHTLRRTQDGSSWTTMYTLNTSLTLRRLVLYMDGAANDTLYIITTQGIYGWDEENSRVVTTRMGHLPRQSDNGYGAAMWRQGEDLFVSAGLEIYRWTISGVAPFSGPSADQGLPYEYRGRIVDLIPEHSGLYALIQGMNGPGEEYVAVDFFDVGQVSQGEIQTTVTQGKNIVLVYNGHGWHPVQIPATSGVPSWFVIVETTDDYLLCWSVDEKLFSISLGRPILNPRERILANQGDFASVGTMELSQFDADMFMYDKLSSHIEIYFSSFELNTVNFELEYRTESSDWTPIIHSFTQGLNIIPLNVETIDGAFPFGRGFTWRWIQFRWTMRTSNSRYSPVLESFSHKFIRIPLKQRAFTFQINFRGDYHGNRPVEEAINDLETMINAKQFVRMETSALPNQSYRVYISGATGAGLSGNDPRGYYSLTLAQVPLEGYNGEPVFG